MSLTLTDSVVGNVSTHFSETNPIVYDALNAIKNQIGPTHTLSINWSKTGFGVYAAYINVVTNPSVFDLSWNGTTWVGWGNTLTWSVPDNAPVQTSPLTCYIRACANYGEAAGDYEHNLKVDLRYVQL